MTCLSETSEKAEYQSSNRLVKYPLAESTSLPQALYGILCDARIVMGGSSNRPYLSALSAVRDNPGSVPGEYSFSATVSGLPSSVSLSCSVPPSSGSFIRLSGVSGSSAVTIVVSSEGIRDAADSAGGLSVSGISAGFEPRCVDIPANEVSSVSIYNGVPDGSGGYSFYTPESDGPTWSGITGDVKILPGHNFRITSFREGSTVPFGPVSDAEADISGDASGRIVLNAVAGAGEGAYGCSDSSSGCDGDASWLECYDGHARVMSESCYETIPDAVNGILHIISKCSACCTCQQYADQMERLKSLYDRSMSAKAKLDEAVAEYTSEADAWASRLSECRLSDITVTASFVKGDPADTDVRTDGLVGGRMGRAGIGVTVRNRSFVTVVLSGFSLYSPDGEFRQTACCYTGADGAQVNLQSLPASAEIGPNRSASVSGMLVSSKIVKTASDVKSYRASFSCSASYVPPGGSGPVYIGTLRKEVSA